jgi:hypothetical protein
MDLPFNKQYLNKLLTSHTLKNVWLNTITMKKLTTLYFLLTASLVFGQFVDLGQKGFGGTGDDYLKRYEDTVNHAFYYVGYSNSNASFDKGEDSRGGNDIWIVKTDSVNNFLWDKTIGGSGEDGAIDCRILNNKIFILGKSTSPISGEKTMDGFGLNDGWLIVIDTNGNILWQQQYGGVLDDYLNTINILPNGNLLLAGSSDSPSSLTVGNKTSPNKGGLDIWILEINPNNGSIIKQVSIGSSGIEIFTKLIITQSGKIIIKAFASNRNLNGDLTDPGFGNSNMWIVTLDLNLNKLIDKCFGSGGEGTSGDLIVKNDAYYFVVSSQSNAGGNKTAPLRGCLSLGSCQDYWVVKTDTNLNIIWDQSYGGNREDIPTKIEFGEWNKLIISGSSKTGIGGNKTTASFGFVDVWALIVNESDGSIVTQQSFGGSGSEDGSFYINKNDPLKIRLESNSKSGISGNKTTINRGGYDFWMVELDASDFLATEELDAEGASVSVYPNPYSEQVNFKLKQLKEAVTLSIATLDGKIVHTQTIQPSNENIEITWNPISTEQFLVYTIKGAKTNFTGKLVGF